MAADKPSVAFLDHFAKLRDPRLKRKQLHSLKDIIFVAFCAVISGCNDFTEMEIYGKSKIDWLRKFVPLENGIPSHDTFGRVFSLVDDKAFLECFIDWVNALCIELGGKVIGIDGKTARASLDSANGKKALHIVSAWVGENAILLGQMATDEKSNEITAVPKLLEILEISGAIVTADAMSCQKEIVEKIREKDADYVLPVKGNQPKLQEAIIDEFATLDEAGTVEKMCDIFETEEKGHGRKDHRRYETMNMPIDFTQKDGWKDLKSIGRVTRVYFENGEMKTDVRYFIVSFSANAKKFARAVRGEWGVENGLHWVLDVEFDEDLSRARKGNAQNNLGLLRRWVLSMLRQDTSMKSSIKNKRNQAGWNNEVLENLLGL